MTTYEVLWGIEDHERQTWIDYGDSSATSRDALALANRTLAELIANGRRVGFFVNGVHKAGAEFAAEWAESDVPGAHKTRTFLDTHDTHLNWRKVRIVGDPIAWAVCSCGWKKLRDNRALARRAARQHRENPQNVSATITTALETKP